MIKKILVALALVIGLQFMAGSFWNTTPACYAQGKQVPPTDGALDSTSFMFDLSAITYQSIKGTVRQSWTREGLNYFFKRAISVMAAVIGSLSVLMLSVGGFMMLVSGGDETTYEKGKNFASYSLIGLGVTLLAYILVNLVQLLVISIYG